jgi:hypothetical protein
VSAPARRRWLVAAAALLVVVAVTASVLIGGAGRRLRSPARPAADSAPMPAPLGGTGSGAPAPAPPARVLAVDSTGCAPVERMAVPAARSLDDLSGSRGVPVDVLIRGLHLPDDVSRTRPLRELMRTHRFTPGDVERVVTDYLKHCE